MKTHDPLTKSGRVRRTIVAALLAAEMAFAPLTTAITPTLALAADETPAKNGITIQRKSPNPENQSYLGFRVFSAKVQAGSVEGDTKDYATDIQWSNVAVKKAVIGFLDKYHSTARSGESTSDYTNWLNESSKDDPQNALEFISTQITNSNNDEGPGQDEGLGQIKYLVDGKQTGGLYSKVGDSFATQLAQALYTAYKTSTGTPGAREDNPDTGDVDESKPSDDYTPENSLTSKSVDGKIDNVDPVVSLTAGTEARLEEGFYLIVTNPASRTNEFSTAPIWVTAGGHAKEITEKTASAVSTMQVLDDSKIVDRTQIIAEGGSYAAPWKTTADANTEQDLWYRITATLPDNIASFVSYPMKFEVTLPDGMELAYTGTKEHKTYGGADSDVRLMAYQSQAILDLVNQINSFTSQNGGDTSSNITTSKSETGVGTSIEAGSVGEKLTVTVQDIKRVKFNSTAITNKGVVALYFKAHLKPQSENKPVYGKGSDSLGNVMEGTYTYPDNPVDTSSTNSSTSTVSTYAYQLDLTKHDKSDGSTLKGAKFMIQVLNGEDATTVGKSQVGPNSDAASRGMYVTQNGELMDGPADPVTAYAALTTDEARTKWLKDYSSIIFETVAGTGKLPTIKGLDEGTYVIQEIVAPTGPAKEGATNDGGDYQRQDAHIYLTVERTFANGTDKPMAITAKVLGGETGSMTDKLMMPRIGSFNPDTAKHYYVDEEHGNVAMAAGRNGSEAAAAEVGDKNAYIINETDGIIHLMAVDERALTMPITGMSGQQFLILMGGSMVAVSLACGMLLGGRRRKRTDSR